MPIQPSFSQPLAPLSVGNVVSTGLVLYRSHLKSYLSIALRAILWMVLATIPFLIIPLFTISLLPYSGWRILLWIPLYIFGFAKYLANSALISRLAFNELIDQPEIVSNARNYIQARMWSFVKLAFRMVLLLLLVYIMLSVSLVMILAIIVGIGYVFLPLLINQLGGAILSGFIFVAALIVYFLGFIWFFSRWIIAEVPLAVEEDINSKQSIDRSWELTKNSVFRIQLVALVGFLVTLPLMAVTSYIPQIFLHRVPIGSNLYWTIYGISILTSSVGGIFVLPFWQTIKAVLYYDLRNRKEGFDLQLRNSI